MSDLAIVPRRLSDESHSSYIGILLESGKLSRVEFEAAKAWRDLYTDYLSSIGMTGFGKDDDPPKSDLRCEELKRRVYRGIEELKINIGRRAFHAINSLVVYEEPEELGDFEFTVAAAKAGLAHLAKVGI